MESFIFLLTGDIFLSCNGHFIIILKLKTHVKNFLPCHTVLDLTKSERHRQQDTLRALEGKTQPSCIPHGRPSCQIKWQLVSNSSGGFLAWLWATWFYIQNFILVVVYSDQQWPPDYPHVLNQWPRDSTTSSRSVCKCLQRIEVK